MPDDQSTKKPVGIPDGGGARWGDPTELECGCFGGGPSTCAPMSQWRGPRLCAKHAAEWDAAHPELLPLDEEKSLRKGQGGEDA